MSHTLFPPIHSPSPLSLSTPSLPFAPSLIHTLTLPLLHLFTSAMWQRSQHTAFKECSLCFYMSNLENDYKCKFFCFNALLYVRYAMNNNSRKHKRTQIIFFFFWRVLWWISGSIKLIYNIWFQRAVEDEKLHERDTCSDHDCSRRKWEHRKNPHVLLVWCKDIYHSTIRFGQCTHLSL